MADQSRTIDKPDIAGIEADGVKACINQAGPAVRQATDQLRIDPVDEKKRLAIAASIDLVLDLNAVALDMGHGEFSILGVYRHYLRKVGMRNARSEHRIARGCAIKPINRMPGKRGV